MTIALFDLAERRLAWANKRQEVLAQNIANADTPHWQAHDVKPFTAVLARAQGADLMRTQPMHLSGSVPPAGGIARDQRPAARAPDGNTVALDDELTKIADTETTHELVTSLYQKYMGLFRMALGRGP